MSGDFIEKARNVVDPVRLVERATTGLEDKISRAIGVDRDVIYENRMRKQESDRARASLDQIQGAASRVNDNLQQMEMEAAYNPWD